MKNDADERRTHYKKMRTQNENRKKLTYHICVKGMGSRNNDLIINNLE